MALTRSMLKAMSLTEEQIQSIIDSHNDTVGILKAQAEEYKEAAEKLPGIQKKLDEATSGAAADGRWKVKYDAIKEEFDKFKAEADAKATHEAKETAYRELLKEAKVSDKRITSVLKVSAVDDVELDADGKIKGANDLLKAIQEEWSDFIVTENKSGAPTPTPPTEGNNAKAMFDAMSLAEKMAYANEHPQEYESLRKE